MVGSPNAAWSRVGPSRIQALITESRITLKRTTRINERFEFADEAQRHWAIGIRGHGSRLDDRVDRGGCRAVVDISLSKLSSATGSRRHVRV